MVLCLLSSREDKQHGDPRTSMWIELGAEGVVDSVDHKVPVAIIALTSSLLIFCSAQRPPLLFVWLGHCF